jgi:two-component system sensor histidine kinase CpxA
VSNLYWRIFLAFWAVIIATTLITVSFNSLAFRDQQADTRFESGRAALDALSEQAQRALDADGREGLVRWLRVRQRDPGMPLLLIIGPDGQELLDRPLPGPLRMLARRPDAGERGGIGRRRPIGPPRWTLRAPDGARYTVLLARRELRLGGWFLRPEARLLFPLVLVLLSGGACLWLARYLTRPIRAFRVTGQRIATGELDARVGPELAQRPDEFGALARDFDHMADRIEQLLATQQRLLRDVSHELRSPLARLQAAVGLIRQKSGDAADANLDRIEKEAENLNAMIGQILDFVRLENRQIVERERQDVRPLVQRVVEDAAYEGQLRGRRVVFEASAPVDAAVDAALFHSALENVVRNALQHCRSRVEVHLTGIGSPARHLEVTVRDDGPGVREADLDQLFEAFFTAQPSNSAAGAGAGIGLAIARRAVRLQGGTIDAKNAAGGGLVVRIELPTA